jgi:hypothetical protein
MIVWDLPWVNHIGRRIPGVAGNPSALNSSGKIRLPSRLYSRAEVGTEMGNTQPLEMSTVGILQKACTKSKEITIIQQF